MARDPKKDAVTLFDAIQISKVFKKTIEEQPSDGLDPARGELLLELTTTIRVLTKLLEHTEAVARRS